MAKAIYDLLRERIEMGRGEFPQLSWPGERPSLEVFVDKGSWLIFVWNQGKSRMAQDTFSALARV